MTRKKTIVELEPFKFVDVRPVDDPACMRDEDDPSSAFSQYLLPKLKGARDEASREVLEYLKVENLSEAIAHTIQSLPAGKTKKLRDWVEEANSSRVYVYCAINIEAKSFAVGLMLTSGKYSDKILAEEEFADMDFSNDFAQTNDVQDAIAKIAKIARADVEEDAPPPSLRGPGSSLYLSKALEAESKRNDKQRAAKRAARKRKIEKLFEEENNGIVYVENRRQYEDAVKAMGLPVSSSNAWKGVGVYDFYPQPPKFLGTLDEWEHACAVNEAEYILDEYHPEYYLESNRLKTACAQLRSA